MEQRRLSLDSNSHSRFDSQTKHLHALGVITNKPLRKIFKNEDKLPYMKSQIDLSFPEILNQSKIELDRPFDRESVCKDLEQSRQKINLLTKSPMKIANFPRVQEDYKKSYFNSSIVPRDYTRHTYISKDNCFYFNGIDNLLTALDEKTDPL